MKLFAVETSPVKHGQIAGKKDAPRATRFLPREIIGRRAKDREKRDNDFRSRQELIIPSSKTPRVFASLLATASPLCHSFFGGKGGS